ncbi:MAG TPA: AAA family ATPase, partial [Gemmatimonadales bacterium]
MTDADIAAHAETGARLMQAVGSVVLGQERAIREALGALIARGHVLLEGVPGTAKTLLVRALSESLSLGFRRIQFTPDLMPSDVTGVSILGADGQ